MGAAQNFNFGPEFPKMCELQPHVLYFRKKFLTKKIIGQAKIGALPPLPRRH